MIQTLNIAASSAFACTLDRKALGAALTLAAKVTERRNTIPILSMVRLDLAGDVLTIRATDLDMHLAQPLAADHAAPGSLCVDLTTLASSVRKMKGATVRIQDIGGRIVLTDTETGGSVRIPTRPATDWPGMGAPVDPACFTIPAAQFALDLARIRPAISTEETRYYLNGINFHPHRAAYPAERTAEHEAATVELAETKAAYQLLLDEEGGDVKEGGEALAETAMARIEALKDECAGHEAVRSAPDSLRMAATDGHRLHYITRPIPDGAERLDGAILPRKAVAVILAILGKKAEGDVSLAMSRDKFIADMGAVQLHGKMIDGTFPDYTRVIPSANDKLLTIDAAEVIHAAQGATAHCNEKRRAVAISLSAEAVIFSATDVEGGTAAVQAHGAEFTGEEFAIGFNAAYLADVAKAFGEVTLAVNLADAAAPTLFRTPDVPEFEAVLMPMRVDASPLSLADIERLNRSPWDSFAEDIAVPARTGQWKEVGRLVRAVREYLGNNAVDRAEQRFAIKFAILAAQNDPVRLTRLSDIHAALAAGPRGSFRNLGVTATAPAPAVAAVQPVEVDALVLADAVADVPLADIKVPVAPMPDVPAEVKTPPPAQTPQEPAPAVDAPDVQPDRVAALEARLATLEAIIRGQAGVPVDEIQPDKDLAEKVGSDPAPVEAGERAALEAEINRLRATVQDQASTIARLSAGRNRAARRLVFMRGAIRRETDINKQLLGQIADMLKVRDQASPTPLPKLPASLQPPKAFVLPAVATSRRETVNV